MIYLIINATAPFIFYILLYGRLLNHIKMQTESYWLIIPSALCLDISWIIWIVFIGLLDEFLDFRGFRCSLL